MTVVLLDPRWPTLIPAQARGKILAPVTFHWEVPVSLRWDFDALIDGEDPTGQGTHITLDENDEAIDGRELIRAESLDDPIWRARKLMARARKVGEWEASHTHETLLAYLEEETQEFIEAVHSGDATDIKKELSDVFLQVLFHSEVASTFDLDDVAEAFIEKMSSRSPYLADPEVTWVDVSTQDRLWQEGKSRERGHNF